MFVGLCQSLEQLGLCFQRVDLTTVWMICHLLQNQSLEQSINPPPVTFIHETLLSFSYFHDIFGQSVILPGSGFSKEETVVKGRVSLAQENIFLLPWAFSILFVIIFLCFCIQHWWHCVLFKKDKKRECLGKRQPASVWPPPDTGATCQEWQQ